MFIAERLWGGRGALVDENRVTTLGGSRAGHPGAKDTLVDLTHHCDHGSQYTSIAYHEKFADYPIKASTGIVGEY